MKPSLCSNCDREKNAPEGICNIENAADGYPVRCVGGWSKLFYLKRYIDTFTTSMRNIWEGQLYYIDLFAGPGMCRVREDHEEIEASPLLALNSRYSFKRCFFVDLSEKVLNVLLERCGNNENKERVELFNGDCNEAVDLIIDLIPEWSLSMAFIDPTGLDFKFSTVEKLACRKVDLIITFPDNMAISRNFSKFLTEETCPLDHFVGDRGWRECKSAKEVTEYYKKKLISIGYQEILRGDEIPIRSIAKNLPLYTLLFASKHPLGHKFWKEISEINHTGQRKLPLS